MAKRKTKYTQNRNRILRYIRKLNKNNILVDIYIPTEREVRAQGVKGSELTKLTRELKALTPQVIKSYGREIETENKNILESGLSNLEVQGFKNSISNFPKEIADKVISLIDTLINEQAQALEKMPYQLHDYLKRNKYDSGSALEAFSMGIIEYLPNASEQYKKDLSDAFEYNEIGFSIED